MCNGIIFSHLMLGWIPQRSLISETLEIAGAKFFGSVPLLCVEPLLKKDIKLLEGVCLYSFQSNLFQIKKLMMVIEHLCCQDELIHLGLLL